jgi:hypothetical protein
VLKQEQQGEEAAAGTGREPGATSLLERDGVSVVRLVLVNARLGQHGQQGVDEPGEIIVVFDDIAQRPDDFDPTLAEIARGEARCSGSVAAGTPCFLVRAHACTDGSASAHRRRRCR